MIVKCIKLPPANYEYVSHIAVDEEYLVFALLLEKGELRYCIADNQSHETNMPVWYPEAFFTVTNTEIPAGWHIGKEDGDVIVTFKEWASSNGEFYYWLVEDRDSELMLYNKYIQQMASMHPQFS